LSFCAEGGNARNAVTAFGDPAEGPSPGGNPSRALRLLERERKWLGAGFSRR
jgi:hypothetical protein